MESSDSSSTVHERVRFVENVVLDEHAGAFRDVLGPTLRRIEHETPGMVVSVRLNVVRRMTAPEIVRLKLDPGLGTWLELTGDVLRVPNACGRTSDRAAGE